LEGGEPNQSRRIQIFRLESPSNSDVSTFYCSSFLCTYMLRISVCTSVFEVTSQAAKDWAAPTRPSGDDVVSGLEITVTPFFAASTGAVTSIPIWHVNQYTSGVEEGVNGGGPSPRGQRNVINLDRGDAGYRYV